MGFLDALRRPAVRVPILLVVTVVAGALLSRQCNQMVRARALATSRHLLCLEAVTRAAREAAAAGRRPESLAELVGSAGKPGALERLFRREYAELPEFAAAGSESPAPAVVVRGVELLWEDYRYRLWPSPNNAQDFVIFAWPEAAGAGRLTSAVLSAEPERHYFTSAERYAGAGAGPTPADLGEPFAGRVSLLPGLDARTPREDFLQRAAKSGGRLWAAENLRRTSAPEPAGKR